MRPLAIAAALVLLSAVGLAAPSEAATEEEKFHKKLQILAPNTGSDTVALAKAVVKGRGLCLCQNSAYVYEVGVMASNTVFDMSPVKVVCALPTFDANGDVNGGVACTDPWIPLVK